MLARRENYFSLWCPPYSHILDSFALHDRCLYEDTADDVEAGIQVRKWIEGKTNT